MKKIVSLFICIIMLLALVGCARSSTNKLGLNTDGVKSVMVSSLPSVRKGYLFDGEKAEKLVNYLTGLDLKSKFSENPDEYTGMTWVISIEYEDGKNTIVYHFGNMFIKNGDGSWFRMNYEQAEQLDTLLAELSK